MSNEVEGMTIDWETADRITVLNLKQYVQILTEHIEQLETLMDQGDLAHYQQQDYMDNVSTLKAITKVLKYFGEE